MFLWKPSRKEPTRRLVLEALESRTLLSVCTVDRLSDNNPVGGGEGGNGRGDLRYCITHAADGNIITFDAGVAGTINLAGALPDLTQSVRITGPGADLLTVRRNAGGNYRIFTVAGSPAVTISGLTLANGLAPVLANGNAEGGGLYVAGGRVTLADSVVADNQALASGLGWGGGLFVAGGTVLLRHCIIARNTVGGFDDAGGGIYSGGTLTVVGSSISANHVLNNVVQGGLGGGIYNAPAGVVIVRDSSVSGNLVDYVHGSGAGVLNLGTMTM